jgi:hypothetical protein
MRRIMQTLIDMIISEIERSTVAWREGAKGNRNIEIKQKDLDALGKQNFLKQAAELESQGFVRCKWITGRSDISHVNYSYGDVRALYKKAGKIPKSDRIREMKEAVEEQVKKIHKPWIRAYYDGVLKSLEAGKEPEELSHENRELNFNCFLGIDRLEGSVYKRVFSKQYLGGSKVFEKKLQKSIASIAKKYYNIIDDNMTESEILAQIYLDHYADELSLKGDLLIKIDDKEIDLSLFPYGTVLNSVTLKNVSIVPEQKIKKIITVENKANYMTFPFEAGTLVLFSHGYFSLVREGFLESWLRSFRKIRWNFTIPEIWIMVESGFLNLSGIKCSPGSGPCIWTWRLGKNTQNMVIRLKSQNWKS